MQRTAEIRKMIAAVEDTHREAGQTLETPSRKCVVAAVISNPFAGQPDADLDVLKDIGADISAKLVARGDAAEDDVDEGFSFMAPPAGLECNDEDECVMPDDMYDDVE